MNRIDRAICYVIEHGPKLGQKWIEESAMKIATKAELPPSTVLKRIEDGIQFFKELAGDVEKKPRTRRKPA